MPPAAWAAPSVCMLPAATAAAAMLGGNDAGALTPKKIAWSSTRAITRRRRLDLRPDIDAAAEAGVGEIVEHALRDRRDRSEFFDVQVLVAPRDLARLLEARIAGDPVRDGERGEDREPGLRLRDRDLLKRRERDRLGGQIDEKAVEHVLGYEGRNVSARELVVVGHRLLPLSLGLAGRPVLGDLLLGAGGLVLGAALNSSSCASSSACSASSGASSGDGESGPVLSVYASRSRGRPRRRSPEPRLPRRSRPLTRPRPLHDELLCDRR